MTPRATPGLDPAWSRTVRSPDAEGVPRTWHVLDNLAQLQERGEQVVGTVVCVHGNPTWSYLWRRVLAQAPPGWRVVAPDHLGMGWSERLTDPRGLGQRIADLDALTTTLGVSGPVVLLAHDWGGPIGLGWALRQRTDLAGVVLTNTAVHQPSDAAFPAAIRVAHSSAMLDLVCRRTPAFVRAATATCRPALPAPVRDAFAAPYATAGRRQAGADFVADIPFRSGHPSAPVLDDIAGRLSSELADVPTLLVWGPRDPVFSQRYLEDLLRRLPHADVHRYQDASHLVLEDRPEGVDLIWSWIEGSVGAAGLSGDPIILPFGAEASRDEAPGSGVKQPDSAPGVPIRVDTTHPDDTSIAELTDHGRTITFGALAERVAAVAAALHARGVREGDRVAVLVPPGIDLTTLVYAVWRLGGVIVVADAGLGLRRLGGALRGAGPDHVVGIGKALLLARGTRVPGQRIRFDTADADTLALEGAALPPAPEPAADAEADGAILFTSGATGPPKGVIYTRGRLEAQVALLRDTFDLVPGDRLVAAFAPFALYGPALGLGSAVPDMDVTAPHTLTAAALAEAVAAVRASVVFASPAALRNVVATADDLTRRQAHALQRPRLVLSAGAPVPVALLHRVRALLPHAATHTPYGMTEALPVATIDPTTGDPTDTTDTDPATGEPDGPGGVCVGIPVDRVEVRIAPLDAEGRAGDGLTDEVGVTGEIVVRGPHTKARYDRLWGTQQASERPAGWHRTGDVGELDDRGRLWVQGRLVHVVSTPDGPVTPYAVEHRIERLDGVSAAAVVGVGPRGTQQVVAVVVPEERIASGLRRLGGTPLAGADLAARVRETAGVPVAAVLLRDWLPVDVRHASKVDRGALAVWATRLLHDRPAARALARRSGQAPATKSR
ncbi:alpha/beta fold hydrolase [Ornithinicoccus hortensis]|uniref:alpha/beta fold hydrolase n=1 Tax=Ornithinicoccus hortensis TaxID=82346 RepID=UPI0031DE3899